MNLMNKLHGINSKDPSDCRGRVEIKILTGGALIEKHNLTYFNGLKKIQEKELDV